MISPLLANLFLHYAFDAWMRRTYPDIPFERYADDGICLRMLRPSNSVRRNASKHGPIKLLCGATLGFTWTKTAYAPIKGFEVMRMIRKRECIQPGVTGEVRFVNKLSDLAA